MLRCYFIEVQINICAIHQFNVFSFTTKSVAIYIMNIQEAKAIPLADYLQCLGYSPVKRQGCNLWYKSPLRTESEPSFKVNTELNRWFDFGLSNSIKKTICPHCWNASDGKPTMCAPCRPYPDNSQPHRVFNGWK